MSAFLCVDFDFFFPNPVEAGDLEHEALGHYDWGHSEHFPPALADILWTQRAAAFVASGLSLPQVVAPSGGWAAFWSRFEFAPNAEFFFADSNAHAAYVKPPDGTDAFDEVVLFDAHHDSGYNIETFEDYLQQRSWSCEDWMLEHQAAGTTALSVRYPQWKRARPSSDLPEGVLTRQMLDDGAPVPVVFDALFVCRSGAWVPPWCDKEFWGFLAQAPMAGTQVDDGPLDRGGGEDWVAAAERAGEILGRTFAAHPLSD